MNRRFLFLLWISVGAVTLFAQTSDIPDILYRQNGAVVSGRIVEADERFVRMQVSLGPDRQGVISIPLSDVDRATFAPNPDQAAFLSAAGFQDLARLLNLWKERRALLRLEGSDAIPIGLALARALRNSPHAAQREEALALYQLLESEARLSEHLAAARQGRLQALIALDRAQEAVEEARELLATTEDPAVLIEAKFVLAEAARRQFESLVEENPRWEEDLAVRPERHRLYHEIIDLYLYPFLFHGSEQVATARSLGHLLTFLTATGDLPEARHIAQDLLTLYPGQSETEVARQFLEHHPQPTEPHHETAL